MLVHEYFKIDQQVIWDIVQLDLPVLKATVQKMLQEMK